MVTGKGGTEGLAAIDMPVILKVRDMLMQYKALKVAVDLGAAYDASFWAKVPLADKKL